MCIKVNLGPLPCQNDSSFSRRNDITNQITDKLYMIKDCKKQTRSLGLHRYSLYIILRSVKVHLQRGRLSIYYELTAQHWLWVTCCLLTPRNSIKSNYLHITWLLLPVISEYFQDIRHKQKPIQIKQTNTFFYVKGTVESSQWCSWVCLSEPWKQDIIHLRHNYLQ